MSPLSRAQTLPAGQSEIAVAAEVIATNTQDGGADEGFALVGLSPLLSYRRGLDESVDAAVRLYVAGVQGDIRYSLARGTFSASVGAEVGISSVTVTVLGSTSTESLSFADVPLYLEYELSSSVSVMAVPRVGYAFGRLGNVAGHGAITMMALALPISVGSAVFMPSVGGGLFADRPTLAAGIGVSY